MTAVTEHDDDDVLAASSALALEDLEATDPAAADLLKVISFTAPDDISRRMLLGGAAAMPRDRGAFAANSTNLGEAIYSLKSAGLVHTEGNSVRIHRDWQSGIRDHLDASQRETWCRSAGAMLLAQFPLEFDVRDWYWLQRLVPHCSVAIGHMQAYGIARVVCADLRCRISIYYLTQGQYKLALETLTQAIDSLSDDESLSRLMARCLNYKAVAQRELGLIRTASDDADKALSIHRGSLILKPTQPAAEHGSRSPLSASDAARGASSEVDDDPDVVRDLHNLGIIRRLEGGLPESVTILKEALQIDEGLRGEKAWFTASIVEDIVVTCIYAKLYRDAVDWLKFAVEIREGAGGADRVETLMAKLLLDMLLDPKSFDVNVREMVDLSRREYGERHPSVSSSLRALASLARDRNDYDEADRLLREADELDVANFGARSFNLIEGHVDAMMLNIRQDKPDVALARLGEAFAIISDLPEGEWETVFNIAMRDKAVEFAVEARPLVDDILPLLDRVGLDGVNVKLAAQMFVMRVKNVAGTVLVESGAFDEARFQYESAMVIAQETETLLDDALFEVKLGALSALDGDFEKIEQRFRQAQRLWLESADDPNWTLIDHVGRLPSPVRSHFAVVEVVDKLMDEAAITGALDDFTGSLGVTVPTGWFVKESFTLLAPDGQANVIWSSEPLESTVTTERYASVQGELLREEFPEYVEHSFENSDILGDRPGFVRTFSWTPTDGVAVTQVQYYYANDGRGYTATATTPSTNYEDIQGVLRQALRQIKILDDAPFNDGEDPPSI